MRPTLYHFLLGTRFRTGPCHIFSAFVSYALFIAIAPGTEMSIWEFLMFTINDRDGSQEKWSLQG